MKGRGEGGSRMAMETFSYHYLTKKNWTDPFTTTCRWYLVTLLVLITYISYLKENNPSWVIYFKTEPKAGRPTSPNMDPSQKKV
jgi:hypothetical protein